MAGDRSESETTRLRFLIRRRLAHNVFSASFRAGAELRFVRSRICLGMSCWRNQRFMAHCRCNNR